MADRSLLRISVLAAALAFFCLALAPTSSRGEDATAPRILLLNSWHPEQPWQAALERGIRDGLREADQNARIYVEYLDAARFTEDRIEAAHSAFFDAKYSETALDLVISEGLPAGRFLVLNPDLFAGAERLYLRAGSVAPADASQIDFNVNVELAVAEMLRVADPRHVIVVADMTQASGETRVAAAKAAVARLQPHATVEYLLDLPLAELQERVANLPPESAIFYLPIFRDGAGEIFVPYEAVRRIAASANAPVFSAWDTLVGSGIVGGRLLSVDDVGRIVAEHIIAIMHGRAPVMTERTIMRPIYDSRQLRRWNISADRLPADAVIRFEDVPVWKEYRWVIISALAVIVLLSVFSAAMIVLNRRLKHVTSLLEAERAQLEARVLQRTRQLEDSNEELQQFARAISHDLNNPLGAARGFLSLLGHSTRKTMAAGDADLLTQAGAGIDKAINMVRGLLEYSRATGGEKLHRPVSTASVLVDVRANLAKLVRDTGTRIEVGELPTVVGNETQLLRLFQNLIENAIKYRREDVAPIVRVACRQVGGECVFTVEDNGLGMSETDQKTIFNLFTRLKSAGDQSGSGIGLAQCKTIAEKHGGSIDVSSVPGMGSVFTVRLPAAAGGDGLSALQ